MLCVFTYYVNSYIISHHLLYCIHLCFTPGTNLQKKELFVMAVRSPSGKTFPGNFTIIPSSKKWVFHAIYCLAFVTLYGEHICSLNRLVLTDEEDAEYRSFESLIQISKIFQCSSVMLCTFHAIWLPFKRDIYHLLPAKKSKDGKLIELTDDGRNWCEFLLFITHFNFQ